MPFFASLASMSILREMPERRRLRFKMPPPGEVKIQPMQAFDIIYA